MKRICIELHTDNNYVIPTIVTITSMLKNKNKDSVYEIRVLGNNLTDYNTSLIEKLGINVIPHTTSLAKFEGKHLFVSSTDLFKFDLPEVLSDWDKVLYVDTDMIIQGDLSEIFNVELGDNYIAAVKDMAGMVLENHHKRLDISNYFNAGMMLMNLKKMREDNIREKLIDYKLNKDIGYFMSQDALNSVFEEKVVWLHPKNNYMPSNISKCSNKEICEFYDISAEDCKDLDNATIIHLTNQKKPWKYKNTYGEKLWQKYFKISVCKNEKLKYEDLPLVLRNKFLRKLSIVFYIKVGNRKGLL